MSLLARSGCWGLSPGNTATKLAYDRALPRGFANEPVEFAVLSLALTRNLMHILDGLRLGELVGARQIEAIQNA